MVPQMNHARRSGDTDAYHQCDLCDKKFTEKGTLKRHKKQFHEGVMYPCNDCDATYDTTDKLKEHWNVAHSTDEEFQCKVPSTY